MPCLAYQVAFASPVEACISVLPHTLPLQNAWFATTTRTSVLRTYSIPLAIVFVAGRMKQMFAKNLLHPTSHTGMLSGADAIACMWNLLSMLLTVEHVWLWHEGPSRLLQYILSGCTHHSVSHGLEIQTVLCHLRRLLPLYLSSCTWHRGGAVNDKGRSRIPCNCWSLVGATWDTASPCSCPCNLISYLTVDSTSFDAQFAAGNV